MLVFIITFSVIAALLNAWSAVIQRYETGDVDSKELFKRNIFISLSKNPKWLGAFGLQILAFLFQAAALRKGSLITVQLIMVVDLVFLMLILHFYKKVKMGKYEWLAIAMICLGLSGTLIFASPSTASKPYSETSLSVSMVTVALIILISIFFIRRTKSKNVRALISATSAGFSFALVDAFTKIVSGQIGHGLGFLFSNFGIWGLAVTGIVAIVMTQNTYSSGPVTVSQPTMEIVEPIIGVALAIYVFGDSVNLGVVNITFALLSAIIAGSGIVILSKSKRLKEFKL